MSNINLGEIVKQIEIEHIIKKKKFSLFLIRCFDIFMSLLGIVFLLPVFVVVSFLIFITSGGPRIFKQERVGKNLRLFKIYKFRTMITNQKKDNAQITIGEDSRITKIGRGLRKLKIDELPQLFNVLKGDMSFVGPRPEVPKYVQEYNNLQRTILKIRPGITEEASLKYYNESDLLAESSNPEKEYVEVIMPDKNQYGIC